MRLEDHRARATICVTIESRCGFRRAFPPVTSSLESGRRHIAGAAQTSQSASDPMGGMGETQCERAHIGSIDANAGLQVPCNPASSLERATGIEPATSSLGISFRWSHELSLPIRIHHLRPHGPGLGFSRFVIPSHAIWAASWAAGATSPGMLG